MLALLSEPSTHLYDNVLPYLLAWCCTILVIYMHDGKAGLRLPPGL